MIPEPAVIVHIAVAKRSLVAKQIRMFNGALENMGDRLNAAMRVPGKAFRVSTSGSSYGNHPSSKTGRMVLSRQNQKHGVTARQPLHRWGGKLAVGNRTDRHKADSILSLYK